MTRHRPPTEIENPDAYHRAVQNQIFARATAKRQREWDAQHPELAAWLNWTADFMVTDDGGRTYHENPNFHHPLGPVPTFVRDARNKWGSLTEGQTAALQRIYDERTQRAADRAAQRAAEAATAQPWTAGRQVVEGTVLSVKHVESFAGRGYSPALVTKMLVKRDDGSKIYLSCPRSIDDAFFAAQEAARADESLEYPRDLASWLRGKRVRFTAKVEPKTEEPTFAFGSRPTKGEVVA